MRRRRWAMKTQVRRLLVVTLFCLAAHTRAFANDGHHLQDEWEPVDRIVVSTGGDKMLNPLVQQVVREALTAGVGVVIADHDVASQDAILNSLLNQNFIKARSDVQILNSPLP